MVTAARRGPADGGFTLIELLLAILLLGVIVPTIAAAFVIGFRTGDDTTTRITDSAQLQIAASYFATDVASTETVSTTDTQCGGTTPLVRFLWVDSGTTKVVSYYTDTASGATRLLRAYCVNGGTPLTTVLARSLSSTAPSVSCAPDCTSSSIVSVQLRGSTSAGLAFTLFGTRRSS